MAWPRLEPVSLAEKLKNRSKNKKKGSKSGNKADLQWTNKKNEPTKKLKANKDKGDHKEAERKDRLVAIQENKRLDQVQREQKERRVYRQNLLKALQEGQENKDLVPERILRANEIRAKVGLTYEKFVSSDQHSIELTPNELVFASIAIASDKDERHKAIELIKASEQYDEALKILFESLQKSQGSRERKDNIIYVLDVLGQSSVVHEVLSGEQSAEPAIPLTDGNILDWTVLPPGWWNDRKYTDHIALDRQAAQLVLERLRYVDQLDPLERWRSEQRFGLDPYWVFVFSTHVVAECPTHGNAVYVIKGTKDWRNLLSRSKTNLLKNFPQRVVRIIHTGNWQLRLRRVLSIQ